MKIGVIGTTGEGKATSSGQEIRTKILIDALCDHYGPKNVYLMDSGLAKKSKAKAMMSLLKCLLTCKDIVLIVSRNGLHFFLPLLSMLQKYAGKRVYNNIIGGNILELIEENPKYPQYMSSFVVNWVQMTKIVEELKKIGVDNVELLPNSKPIQAKKDSEYTPQIPLKFCTFSRISKAKGIENAISSIVEINTKHDCITAILDIYGVPDKDYKKDFDILMKNVPDYIQYRGLVKFDKSPEVLSQYFMLLFPTTFYGEGFPGTILDAYAAGLPVIASNWRFNSELIQENITGFTYQYDSQNALTDAIEYAICHAESIANMRKSCLAEAQKYTPEKIMPIIFRKIDQYN